MKWGAVVFLDRLGTKAIWTRDPAGEALRRSVARLEKAEKNLGERRIETTLYFADFSSTAATSTVTAEVSPDFLVHDSSGKPWTIEAKLQQTPMAETVIGFSDSIIVWREFGQYDFSAFESLCRSIIGFFNATLADGDFYRGVVSVGQFVATNRAVLGPAVHEAGEWYESVDWMGVSLTPSAEWFVKSQSGWDSSSAPFVEAPLRLVRAPTGQVAESETRRMALAWPRSWSGGKNALLKVFQGQLVTPDVESKYRNTLDFFDKVVGP